MAFLEYDIIHTLLNKGLVPGATKETVSKHAGDCVQT